MVMIDKSNLPYFVKDEDIVRGKIFRAAFPYLEERPLSFLEECSNHQNCNHCGTGQDYCGRIVSKSYGFEDGREMYVVTRFKARHAIVLSADMLNSHKGYPNVLVAPIIGIHPNEIQKPKYQRIINGDKTLFTAYYLNPSVTGMHSFIDLGRISPIPKTWLLQEKTTIESEDKFNEISERIGMMLAQKRLADCENCTKPCEKCEIKEQVEQLKKQLEKRGA